MQSKNKDGIDTVQENQDVLQNVITDNSQINVDFPPAKNISNMTDKLEQSNTVLNSNINDTLGIMNSGVPFENIHA